MERESAGRKREGETEGVATVEAHVHVILHIPLN